MSTSEPRLSSLAEAVVFAHEPGVADAPACRERDELEHAAALATLAVAGCEPLPPNLGRRLAAAGLAFCAQRQASARHEPVPATAPPAVLRPVGGQRAWAAFAVGAAAVALLWLGSVLLPGTPRPPLGEGRAALLAAPDALRLAWQAGPSPLRGAVAGDVVWSDERQQGYLKFQGLPPLDATHRFQLWIVDAERGGPPVDGGLFTVADAGVETFVPVRPKLPVGRAGAFVVTVEDELGAVVSEQEHVVALAAR